MGRDKQKESVLEKASELFNLPGEVVAGMPLITITGTRRVHVENHRGIMEYGKEEIHINGGRMIIKLRGRDLKLKAMSDAELLITGVLSGVEFVV